MQELLNAIVLVVILLCALSVTVSLPLTGKFDAFYAVRPVAKWALKQPGRLCRSLSKVLWQWSQATWRAARRPTTPMAVRILLHMISAVFGAGSIFLAIPANIIGSVPKK